MLSYTAWRSASSRGSPVTEVPTGLVRSLPYALAGSVKPREPPVPGMPWEPALPKGHTGQCFMKPSADCTPSPFMHSS